MENNNPMISVLMPVYNAEKYLCEAIESILNQTYINFEFIIINDGSTDNSLGIIKKYKYYDERIILLDRKKRGLIESLNEGLSKTKGKYIARMDSDDISLPRRFEKQLAFMENYKEIGVCGTWIKTFGDIISSKKVRPSKDDQFLKTNLLFSVPFSHPSVMIRSEVIKDKFQYNSKYDSIEDYKLWLDMSRITKFSTVEEILLKYRIVNTGISVTAEQDFSKRMESTKKVFDELILSLDMVNSFEEDRIHFIIGFNERIIKNNLDVFHVLKYLIKILIANKKKHVFHKKKLKKFLIKRFSILIYFKVLKFEFKSLLSMINFKFLKNLLTFLII